MKFGLAHTSCPKEKYMKRKYNKEIPSSKNEDSPELEISQFNL